MSTTDRTSTVRRWSTSRARDTSTTTASTASNPEPTSTAAIRTRATHATWSTGAATPSPATTCMGRTWGTSRLYDMCTATAPTASTRRPTSGWPRPFEPRWRGTRAGRTTTCLQDGKNGQAWEGRGTTRFPPRQATRGRPRRCPLQYAPFLSDLVPIPQCTNASSCNSIVLPK
jgi:hypothetical protein